MKPGFTSAILLILAFLLTAALPEVLRAQTVENFNSSVSLHPLVIAAQQDGKLLVSNLNSDERSLVRLLPDGTFDPGFAPVWLGGPGRIDNIALQPDGRIIIAGFFSSIGTAPVVSGTHVARSNLARLNADGTLDEAFNVGEVGWIKGLALQPDGKILAADDGISDPQVNPIWRFNPDGTRDTSFNVIVSANVNCVALQPDGKILLGTYHGIRVNGVTRNGVARLHTNGTVDTTFNVAAIGGGTGGVHVVMSMPGGGVLAGGRFLTIGGVSRRGLARLLSNGVLDTAFSADLHTDNPQFDQPEVTNLLLQADGRIIIGGATFNRVGSVTRNNLARLHANGSLDSSFSGSFIIPNGGINAACLLANGSLILGGSGWNLSPATSLVRVTGTGAGNDVLGRAGSLVTWQRSGVVPEFWRTEFAWSTDNGTTWNELGPGVRVPGGWQIDGAAIPAGASVRARGYGAGPSDSWSIIETGLGAPYIIGNPEGPRVRGAGDTTRFLMRAGGSDLSYQWRRNGDPLADGEDVSGSTSPVLTLSHLTGADRGFYDVVVSNSLGSVVSGNADLFVFDPFITRQPDDQWAANGETATFDVAVAGEAPFSYTWFRDGEAIPGVNGPRLTVTADESMNGALFEVRVENRFGFFPSAPARLRVTPATTDEFDAGLELVPDAPFIGGVRTLAFQRGGKLMVASNELLQLGSLSRLDAAGTPDTGFGAPPDIGLVHSLAILSDNRMLVSHSKPWPLGGSVFRRLNANGTVDASFAFLPDTLDTNWTAIPLPDGKILLGGNSYTPEGAFTPRIRRLDSDGLEDATFQLASVGGGDFIVHPSLSAFAVQADGKIVVGGNFETIGGQARPGLARLEASGALDSSFNPPAPDFLEPVKALAIQADGKILVARRSISRLLPDGSPDPSFQLDQTLADVRGLALKADGRILAICSFPEKQYLYTLVQFESDGSRDRSLDISHSSPNSQGAWPSITAFALQDDGRMFVGGLFEKMNGRPRKFLARLNATHPAVQHLEHDGSTLRWRRGGSCPEVSWVRFESTSDGVNWSFLGSGQRIDGGWELTGVLLPANAAVRAVGLVVTPLYENFSTSWFTESVLVPGGGVTLSAPRMTPEGFAFDVSGGTGWQVGIEASPDLRTWSPFNTITLEAGANTIVAPPPVTGESRYYRARFPQ